MSEPITILIHMSSSEDICPLEVLKQLGCLTAALCKFLPVSQEWWQVDFDEPDSRTAFYQRDTGKEARWSAGWDSIKTRKIAKAAAVIYCDGIPSSKKIGLTAALVSKAEHIHLQRDTRTRYASIEISCVLWQSIDVNFFTECVKDACIKMGASYACIDETLLTGDIYETGFTMLAKELHPESIENKLPGIYWWQIVSQSFINETGTIDEIAEKVPCQRVEKITCKERSFLLFQLTDDVRQATRKRRLALRDFFQKSLHEITLKKPELVRSWGLADWNDKLPTHRKFFLRCLKMIPLTNEEIDELIGGFENS